VQSTFLELSLWYVLEFVTLAPTCESEVYNFEMGGSGPYSKHCYQSS
jgi:hypothetical protein